MKGVLSKMSSEIIEDVVNYTLRLEDNVIPVNELIGKNISIEFTGKIFCKTCGKQTKKSFNQGFCYKCFMEAPESSPCIVRPELCRAHLHEGRDVSWELENHNQAHVVYLTANDKYKVGITRKTQLPTRWIDQGTSSAIILAETSNRYEAGVIEVALKDLYADKTHWQNMLKNIIDEDLDLVEEKFKLMEVLPSDITDYFTDDEEVTYLHYPVEVYPQKITSLNLEKTAKIEGELIGIKGQYLLFNNSSVFNVRNHSSYEVDLTFP